MYVAELSPALAADEEDEDEDAVRGESYVLLALFTYSHASVTAHQVETAVTDNSSVVVKTFVKTRNHDRDLDLQDLGASLETESET